jgi:DNA-binding NtrC family response regulator
VFAAPDSVSGDLDAFLSRSSGNRATFVGIALLPAEAPIHTRGRGFFDALRKPLQRERVHLAVERARAHLDTLEELIRLREESRSWTKSARLAGRSEAMERLRESVGRIAATDANTLFVGEPGTGKELAARVVHELSARRKHPFVSVECSGVPAGRLEAELFGGATDEVGRATGSVEGARGGVLFLNDVADLAPALQDRLVRVVAEPTAARSMEPGPRFLSATRHDLGRAVEEGRFHEDLYRGLAAEIVHVPPLRERPGDATHLARRFIEGICEMNDLPPMGLSAEAQVQLERYDWPGNIEELRQAVEQAALVTPGGTIQADHLPEAVRRSFEALESSEHGVGRRFRDAKRVMVESFEKSYLQDLMERQHGNVTAAAEEAGMLRSALQRLLRKYDLRSSEFRRTRASKAPRQRL